MNWQPTITHHAIARWLERVHGIDPIGAMGTGAGNVHAMLDKAGITIEEAKAQMMPADFALKVDPGCAFAIKRGRFRFIINGGVLLTVIHGPAKLYRVEDRPELG